MSTVNSIRHWTEHFNQFTNVLISGEELGEMGDTISRGYAQTAADYMQGRLISCAKNKEVEFEEYMELSEKLYTIMQKCRVPVKDASFESLKRCINDGKVVKSKFFINDIKSCDDVQVGIIRAQADKLFGQLCIFANKKECLHEEFLELSEKIVTTKKNCDFADKVALYVSGKLGSEGVHPAALLLKEKVAQLQNLEFEQTKEKTISYMKKLKCFEQGVELNKETAKCVNDMKFVLEMRDRRTQLKTNVEMNKEEVLSKSSGKLVELDSLHVYNFATGLLEIVNGDSTEKLKQIEAALTQETYHMKTSSSISTNSAVCLQDMLESHLNRIAPNGEHTFADFGRALKCVRVEALLVMLQEYLKDEDHANTVSVLKVLEGIKLDSKDMPVGLDNLVHALHDKVYSFYNDRSNGNSQNNIDPNHWKFKHRFGRIAFHGTHKESVTNELQLHGTNEESEESGEISEKSGGIRELHEIPLITDEGDKGKEELNEVVDNVQIQTNVAQEEPVNDDPLDHGNVQKGVSTELKLKALDEVVQSLTKAWNTK